MKNIFEIAGGSVIGRNHKKAGKNNHDAYEFFSCDGFAFGLVADGCGSGAHSEVGAKIGIKLFAKYLNLFAKEYIDALKNKDFLPIDFPFWDRILFELNAQISVLLGSMFGKKENLLENYFLFTIVGFLVLENKTFIFSIGDGAYALNGKIFEIGPFKNNAPPYSSYGILACHQKISVLESIETRKVNSILIGTDGISDFNSSRNKTFGRKSEFIVGGLSQFWQEDKFFKNPDMIRRFLVRVGSCDILPDDTTMIVLRRRKSDE